MIRIYTAFAINNTPGEPVQIYSVAENETKPWAALKITISNQVGGSGAIMIGDEHVSAASGALRGYEELNSAETLVIGPYENGNLIDVRGLWFDVSIAGNGLAAAWEVEDGKIPIRAGTTVGQLPGYSNPNQSLSAPVPPGEPIGNPPPPFDPGGGGGLG